MGRPFSNEEATDFHQIIEWTSGQILTYREWCGLCGAAERLMGKFISLTIYYLRFLIRIVF